MLEIPQFQPEEINKTNDLEINMGAEGDVIDSIAVILEGLEFEESEIAELFNQAKAEYEVGNYEATLEILDGLMTLVFDEQIEDIINLMGLINELF